MEVCSSIVQRWIWVLNTRCIDNIYYWLLSQLNSDAAYLITTTLYVMLPFVNYWYRLHNRRQKNQNKSYCGCVIVERLCLVLYRRCVPSSFNVMRLSFKSRYLLFWPRWCLEGLLLLSLLINMFLFVKEKKKEMSLTMTTWKL